MGALPTLGALAGCIGGDSDEGGGDDDMTEADDDELPEGVHVDGQDLRMPMFTPPDEIHLLGGFARGLDQEEFPAEYSLSIAVDNARLEPGLWTKGTSRAGWENPGEAIPYMYESWEYDPFEITITIRDDVYWSDGEPVRAMDVFSYYIWWLGHWAPQPPSDNRVSQVIGGGEMPDGPDGKVVKWYCIDNEDYRDPMWNGFDSVLRGNLQQHLGLVNQHWELPYMPTHIDPLEDFFQERVESWQRANNGEIGYVDTETGPYWNNPADDSDVEEFDDAMQPYWEVFPELVADGDEWYDLLEWSREPGNIPSTGVWKVEDLRGSQEVVLTPNEHHRHYDRVNFDRVILEYSESDQRTEASLMSNRLDFAELQIPPESMDAVPDQFEEVTAPSPGGFALHLDHNSAFGDRNVRQAFMYATDSEPIAQNIHPSLAEPITIPGGDTWAIEDDIDESWIDETLIEYSQDLDAAAAKMQEAGFERDSDGRWQKDGEVLQLRLATDAESPQAEPAVVEHLQDFGVEIEMLTYDGATFTERWQGVDDNEAAVDPYGKSGGFTMWRGQRWLGFTRSMVRHWVLGAAHLLRALNIFDGETQERLIDHYGSSNRFQAQPEEWEIIKNDLLIEMPPIGEPDGTTEPFNPIYTVNRNFRAGWDYHQPDNPYYNPPHDEPHPENTEYYIKKFAWLNNWFLPNLQFSLSQNQAWANTANWQYPDRDSPLWEWLTATHSGQKLIGYGDIWANPDNPKEGAEVVES